MTYDFKWFWIVYPIITFKIAVGDNSEYEIQAF